MECLALKLLDTNSNFNALLPRVSDVRYNLKYLIYFQLDISIYCLILGIFRNSGYRSILAGELAIGEEPSHELVHPPIFAPGHPALQLADREEFGMPEVLRGVLSAQTDV